MTFDIIALSRIITACRLAAGEHTNKKLAEGQQVTSDSKLRQETAAKQRASCSGRGKNPSESGRRKARFAKEKLHKSVTSHWTKRAGLSMEQDAAGTFRLPPRFYILTPKPKHPWS